MKVSAIQHDIIWEDSAATRKHVEPLIAQAAADGSRIIVLSEMFATGFSMKTARIAEDPDGENERFLAEQARLHGVWLIASIAQWTRPARYSDGRPLAANVAVVAGPLGERYRYAKIHPFTFAGEHEHYVAGEEFLTVDIEGLRVSVFICYDLRFGDEFWQRAAETDLFVVPANWPESRREHWQTLLQARAIENQAYVLGCNRVGIAGVQRKESHSGDSAIIDPLGRVLVQASMREAVLSAEVDACEVSQVRQRFPFLPDRR